MYYKHFILVCYINVKKKKLFIQCEWSYTRQRGKRKKRHPKISITHYHRIHKSVNWHKRVQYRLAKTAWSKNKPNKEATVHNCLFKYGKYRQMFYFAYYFIKQCFFTQLWSNKDVYATSLVTTVLFHNAKRTEKASLYLFNCTCTTPESNTQSQDSKAAWTVWWLTHSTSTNTLDISLLQAFIHSHNSFMYTSEVLHNAIFTWN